MCAHVTLGLAVLLALVACGRPDANPARSPAETGQLVTIGGDRLIQVECHGTGSPTVVLVSGTGGAADEWKAVLPAVASFTRVCAYDRPGTTLDDGTLSPSTPVPQPTTAMDGVRDLRATLSADGVSGPYVVVGASWGAMIAVLFARTDFPQVSGLVTVDGASQFLRDTMTNAQWSGWMHAIGQMDSTSGLEVPDYDASVDEIRASPALPRSLPAVVVTADQPWDLRVGDSGSTWPAWLAAQDRLATDLHAAHVTHTGSGHGISVEQPQRVSNAIRDVVDQARSR